MSGRRNVKPEPNILVRGAYRGYPPRCEQCGWTGVASQDASPYVACVRATDEPVAVRQARHQRTPIANRSSA